MKESFELIIEHVPFHYNVEYNSGQNSIVCKEPHYEIRCTSENHENLRLMAATLHDLGLTISYNNISYNNKKPANYLIVRKSEVNNELDSHTFQKKLYDLYHTLQTNPSRLNPKLHVTEIEKIKEYESQPLFSRGRGERDKRHRNAQIGFRELYQFGAELINSGMLYSDISAISDHRTKIIKAYNNLPTKRNDKGQIVAHYQAILIMTVGLDNISAQKILEVAEQMAEDSDKNGLMTYHKRDASVTLPHNAIFASVNLEVLLELYIIKNPHRFSHLLESEKVQKQKELHLKQGVTENALIEGCMLSLDLKEAYLDVMCPYLSYIRPSSQIEETPKEDSSNRITPYQKLEDNQIEPTQLSSPQLDESLNIDSSLDKLLSEIRKYSLKIQEGKTIKTDCQMISFISKYQEKIKNKVHLDAIKTELQKILQGLKKYQVVTQLLQNKINQYRDGYHIQGKAKATLIENALSTLTIEERSNGLGFKNQALQQALASRRWTTTVSMESAHKINVNNENEKVASTFLFFKNILEKAEKNDAKKATNKQPNKAELKR